VIYSRYLLEAEVNGTRFVARMSKPRRNTPFLPLDDKLFAVSTRWISHKLRR
jgi:hypothetical protein